MHSTRKWGVRCTLLQVGAKRAVTAVQTFHQINPLRVSEKEATRGEIIVRDGRRYGWNVVWRYGWDRTWCVHCTGYDRMGGVEWGGMGWMTGGVGYADMG